MRGSCEEILFLLTQLRFYSFYTVAATHKETKQFYTFYNTLDDTKLYLEKEVCDMVFVFTRVYVLYRHALKLFSSEKLSESLKKCIKNI